MTRPRFEWLVARRLLVPVAAMGCLATIGAYLAAQPDARAVPEAFTMAARAWTKNGGGTGVLARALRTHSLPVLAVGILLLASGAWGRRIVRWLARGARLAGAEVVVVRVGAGLGGVSLAMFGCGLCGVFGAGPWLIVAAGAGCAAAGAGWKARRWRGAEGGAGREPGGAAVPLLVAAGLLLLTDLVASFSPEWFTDGQTYHLALPERFLLTGTFPVLAESLLTFLPLNNEMAYGAVMGVCRGLGGSGSVAEVAAKLLNWALGAGVAVAAGLVAVRLGGGRWGAAAAGLLVVSMPLTQVENEIVFADNYRAFMETMAVLCLLPREGRRGSVALAAAFAGLAMGSKYLSVIRGGALVAALAVLGGRLPWRFLLVSSVTVGPWLARNLLAGHDPVYPFLPGLFQPLRFSGEEVARWMQDNRHYGVTAMTWRSWLTLPWRLGVNPGEADFGTFGAGPLLLGLSPLVLLRRRWPRMVAALAGVGVVEAFVWSGTSHLARYLLPTLVLGCALLGWGLGEVRRAAPGSAGIFTGLLLFATVPALVIRAHHRFNLDDTYGVLGAALGRGSEAGTRTARGFGPELDALPPGDALFVGEDRTLGAGRRWRAASTYNRTLIKEWAATSPDPRRFAMKVRQHGRFAAVILNGEMFQASQGRGPSFALTARELAVVNPWWKSLPVAWRRPPWTGYAVSAHPVK